MVNKSTNINKTNNHHNLLNVKKKAMAYDFGNTGRGLGQAWNACLYLPVYSRLPHTSNLKLSMI